MTDWKKYGIFHLYSSAESAMEENSSYLKVLNHINFNESHQYYGSPALAMTLLKHLDTHYYFHDIENDPLDDILRFAQELNIQDRVTVSSGDSIAAFLHGSYCFSQGDFVFIDPYQPFDGNAAGETFFNVFDKALQGGAKTMLWYGYDNLNEKNNIIDKLQSISFDYPETSIQTFDVWQKCMNQNECTINPGVPGCGIAIANLNQDSISSIEQYLGQIEAVYRDVKFEDETTTLCTSHLVL